MRVVRPNSIIQTSNINSMFDALNEIINSDPESQEKFKQFKINFWQKREKKRKDEKRRLWITSIVLSSSAIISIVFGFYAIRTQIKADKYEVEVDRLKIELQECSDLQGD